MIPILYDAGETAFATNGLGGLSDAITCKVTEERNGAYELEMQYPVDGRHFSDITHSRIIWAVPADGKPGQPFRIYKITKPLNGKCTIYAEHISYQLNHIPVMPFTATSCADALNQMVQHAAQDCPFEVWTDKEVDGPFTLLHPEQFRAILNGQQNSITDVYGKGEYEFDRWTVKLHLNRGTNTGVVIRYGKNLTDLKQEENIEGTITGVCPFWASDETGKIVTLPENAIWSANADNYPYRRTRVVDFTSDFEEMPTEDQLRTRAKKYIEDNNIGIPDVNITIKFVPLWQTENYRDLAVLERVNLCDTISVYYDKLGVTATAKVVKTVYNVLKERYDSIEVGNAKTTLASTISQMGETITNQTQNAVSSLRSWVSYQSQLITGGLGGYITFVYNQDGTPAELLVMDQPSIGSAVNLIRMNNGGIAFSNNGYNGPFVSAWTIDGSFSADFVRTGTMVANRIRGGTLTLGSQDNDSGVLEVYDAANNLVVRADNTGLKVYGSDGSYVVMNATDGFAGYDRNGTKIYWAASQEFHMRNAQVEYDFTLAQTMRYIPIQISTNRGVGLVPYVKGVS